MKVWKIILGFLGLVGGLFAANSVKSKKVKELKKVIGGQRLFGRGRLGINQAHNNLYDFLPNHQSRFHEDHNIP